MDNEKIKMMIPLNPKDWHGKGAETVWVTPIHNNLFRIENTPFFANGVSFQDIVEADPSDGSIVYQRTHKIGGHSTYRIILNKNTSPEQFIEYWVPLKNLGCTYEDGRPTIVVIAIDAPPTADIHRVYSLLEKGLKDDIWSFEEGHCGHKI